MKKVLCALMLVLFVGGALGCKQEAPPPVKGPENPPVEKPIEKPVEAPK